MDLSIIIVNWNSYAMIRDCLASLLTFRPELDFEIIIFDNCSAQRDIDEIESLDEKVKLITGDKNYGFAKANNLAVREAHGHHLLFLNPDTLIVDDSVMATYNLLVSNDSIGIVAPKLINKAHKIDKSCARRLPSIFSMFSNIFMLNRFFPTSYLFTEFIKNYDINQYVQFVSGAYMMTRKNDFLQVGGFPEIYFMYSEDVHLCKNYIRSGKKIYYLANKTVIHLGGGTSKKTRNSKLFEGWFFKSRRLYFKQEGVFAYILCNVLLVVGSSFRLVCVSVLALFYFLLGKKEKADSMYDTCLKYWKVLLLGVGIDLIR